MAAKIKSGVQLESHQVIKRPLVTEKGMHASERLNAYSFEVHPFATKHDIKRAVEELWDVRVGEVRTQNRKGKPRRHRTALGRTRSWKKAVVKLHVEDRIAFF
ncbi:MAG: 50S ribosomal protein L23 [Fuerstiella sp.]|nr:50S ribosomal protein L23 [Fuerstiella sp.]